MIAPARVAAYDTLLAIEAGRADLPHALAHARQSLSDSRDRALAGEIAAGVLRWQAAFDQVAARFTKRPAERLDPEVRVILRLTIFQLLHLDRVPASAAVNDAVSLTRRAGKRSAAPLVNAVLRRVSRERGRLPLPERPQDLQDREAVLDYLAVALSHPRWLVSRWLDRYGFDAAEAWAQFNNTPAPLTLRANRLKTTPDALAKLLTDAGVQTQAGRYAPDALIVTAGNPLVTNLANQGLFVVQDEASQLVAIVADARPGEQVFDACAAPGGKTTSMAAAMEDRGLIVAADVRPRRLELLTRTVAASGSRIVRIVQADAGAPLPFSAEFDCVLLDAPCSGLGTVRRDPDLKWRRKESELAELAGMQLRMLRHTSRVVKPGGRLVYATCSSEPEENEEVVRAFAAESGFRHVAPKRFPRTLVNGDGYLRTYPYRDGLEAFFAAVLVRRSPDAVE
jgi:16S rRNA (cytosine967-C5)-methyltransferase